MKKNIKKILREDVNRNFSGVVVTRPDQVLIVMRGIPGAGKSTRAEKLVGEGVIHSTDTLIEATGDYAGHFARMVESGNWSAHGKMHHQNFLNAKADMLEGKTPVIIDNTNIKANEAKKYVKTALEMGYANENIKFVDVGDGGLLAEALAKRNTHNVGLDTIKRMMASHKGVGNLTIENVMASKDRNRKTKFASVVLDEKSKSKLLAAVGHNIPEGWKVFAHHMTINFGKGLPESLRGDLGQTKNLKAISIGKSDMAMAVVVEGYPTDNKVPHITIAVNVAGGGKPVMSNDITEWTKLNSYINLSGVVTEQIFN